MGPYILIVVVYLPERTIGTLVGVFSTLFSSKMHLFRSILEIFTSETKFWNFEAERLVTGKKAIGKMWRVLSDFAIFFPDHILHYRY